MTHILGIWTLTTTLAVGDPGDDPAGPTLLYRPTGPTSTHGHLTHLSCTQYLLLMMSASGDDWRDPPCMTLILQSVHIL